MATLTGEEIIRQVEETGKIVIRPYDRARVNPNSYNLTLADTLLCYAAAEPSIRLQLGFDHARPVLDAARPNATEELTIPAVGLFLMPGQLYLGSTVEWTETYGFAPRIDGRSSIGRLGVCTHQTAGYGDNGYRGVWTLEITVVHPVRVYPGMRFCQISYETLEGGQGIIYRGKYQDAEAVLPSKFAEEGVRAPWPTVERDLKWAPPLGAEGMKLSDAAARLPMIIDCKIHSTRR